jgi:hypothetical protein
MAYLALILLLYRESMRVRVPFLMYLGMPLKLEKAVLLPSCAFNLLFMFLPYYLLQVNEWPVS